MKNVFRIIITSLLICILFTPLLYANSPKVISLKDGSVIKGEVISLENNIYTIQNAQLGEMKIADSEIASISAETHTVPSIQPTSPEAIPMESEAKKLQAQMMNDPQMMSEAQKLAADPEIQKLLSDPEIMKDILTYDPNKMMNNPKIQALMENPRMKSLMGSMMQKQLPSQ